MSVTSSPLPTFSESGVRLDPAIADRGVLIAEDSPVQRRQLVELLDGLQVGPIVEAADGRSALERLRSLSGCPAVAIVDLEMPGIDGIEFARQLARLRQRPALILVSQADTTIMEAVETMISASGLIVLKSIHKPVDRRQLFDALSRFRECLPPIEAPSGGAVPGRVPGEWRSALKFWPRVCLREAAVTAFEVVGPVSQRECSAVTPSQWLERAVAELLRWPSLPEDCSLALSLSPESLGNGMLPNELLAVVRRNGFAPQRVTIQVGQHSIVSARPTVMSCLNRLRLGGFGLSLDDYCTGYSSIQWLSRLPFTEIKLDRDLIAQAERGQQSRIILEAAIELGVQLGLRTVADGVESAAQLHMLRNMGCERAQGPAVGALLAAADVPDWLRHEAGHRSLLATH